MGVFPADVCEILDLLSAQNVRFPFIFPRSERHSRAGIQLEASSQLRKTSRRDGIAGKDDEMSPVLRFHGLLHEGMAFLKDRELAFLVAIGGYGEDGTVVGIAQVFRPDLWMSQVPSLRENKSNLGIGAPLLSRFFKDGRRRCRLLALSAAAPGRKVNDLAGRVPPGDILNVQAHELRGRGSGDEGHHAVLGETRVGRHREEEFVEAIVRPSVEPQRQGAAVGHHEGVLHRSAQALPGEGFQQLHHFEKSSFDSKLAGDEGEVTHLHFYGEIVGNRDAPGTRVGLRHHAGPGEIVLEFTEAVRVGHGDHFSFFREREETPQAAGCVIDGGGVHQIHFISRCGEFVREEFEVLRQIHPDREPGVPRQDLRSEFQKGSDVVIPRVSKRSA